MAQDKFMSDIHLEEYTDKYEYRQATADDFVFAEGRDIVSLNGEWNYAVDQYDTCIRQDWYKERKTDDKGFTLPVDYSFDEWETMELPCCWNTKANEYLLYEGSILQQGTPESLAADDDVRTKYLGSGFQLKRSVSVIRAQEEHRRRMEAEAQNKEV